MRIPKNVLKRMTGVAAQESTRYAINGVQFKRVENQASAEATDGRMLLRARWNDPTERDESIQGKPFDVILAASAIKATKFPARVKDVELCESPVNGSAKLLAWGNVKRSHYDDTIEDRTVETIDGRFPNTDDTVPDYAPEKCHTFAIDPRLMASLLDTIASIATGEESRGVLITCPLDPTKPIRLDAYDADAKVEATGVLMPVTMGGVSGYRAPQVESDGAK